MKRIYFDGLGLVDGHFSGVGQYIYGILKGIDEIIENSKYNKKTYPIVKVIVPYDSVHRFNSFGFKHIGYKKFPLSFKVMSALWHRNKLPPIDLWCGRGTYIFPRFVGMPLLFNKSMLVIYDLSYELYRQYSDEGNAAFLSKGVKRSIKKTNRVITISSNAKKEITKFYRLNEQFVTVATPATDPNIFYKRSQREINYVKRKYEIEGDYILALSNLEPRKNLEMLIEAYCNLSENMRKNLSLLLVGVNGWKTDILFDNIIRRVQHGYSIIRPSMYVLDEDKPAIISGAKILVYPSHYEGFGMPPLEALACGTPVITSNNSSLPEVVGIAGEMVDSNDMQALKKSIERTLTNITTLRNRAIKEGPFQAQKFSWSNSATEFLNIAKELK